MQASRRDAAEKGRDVTEQVETPETMRIQALNAVRAMVLDSMSHEGAGPLMFGDDEIPDGVRPEMSAAMALSALCWGIRVAGLRLETVRRIFDVVEDEERRSR